MTRSDLERIVGEREHALLEFKATTGQRSDACKSVTAMLNGSGGRVLFGVTPEGVITGQDVSDQTLEQLSTFLSRIEPTVLPVVERIDLPNGKAVISVSVDRGQLKPYEYAGDAYKRVGNTTVKMGAHEKDLMLLERMHGTSRWENQPASGWQVGDLDEDEILKTVKEAVRRGRLEEPGTTDPQEILRRLGLLSREGQVLQAAVALFGKRNRLLPDFPQFRLRLARFRGVDRDEFLDSKDLHGNAFRLLQAAQTFLVENLPVAARVTPGIFERIDDPIYPPEALREALVNAFCHRNYAIGGGSVGVAIYDDRTEVSSIGGLHFGLTIEDLLMPHESLPWNPLIARVFYLRGLFEQWGRGIQKIVGLMERAGLPVPEISAGGGAVTVKFMAGGYVAPTRVPHDLNERQRAILEALAQGGRLSPAEILRLLPEEFRSEDKALESRRTREALTELRSIGLVGQHGRGVGSRWYLNRERGAS